MKKIKYLRIVIDRISSHRLHGDSSLSSQVVDSLLGFRGGDSLERNRAYIIGHVVTIFGDLSDEDKRPNLNKFVHRDARSLIY